MHDDNQKVSIYLSIYPQACCSVLVADDFCEKEVEVDGEPATLTLLDTWDAEVR